MILINPMIYFWIHSTNFRLIQLDSIEGQNPLKAQPIDYTVKGRGKLFSCKDYSIRGNRNKINCIPTGLRSTQGL